MRARCATIEGMPNFDVKIVSGVTPVPWEDTRLEHRGTAAHVYWKVPAPTAPALAEVVIHCLVGGVEAPLDVDLGGNLFVASRIAYAGFPFAIAQTAGQSSEITLRFAANMAGHAELCIRRPGGGAILLSLEVE